MNAQRLGLRTHGFGRRSSHLRSKRCLDLLGAGRDHGAVRLHPRGCMQVANRELRRHARERREGERRRRLHAEGRGQQRHRHEAGSAEHCTYRESSRAYLDGRYRHVPRMTRTFHVVRYGTRTRQDIARMPWAPPGVCVCDNGLPGRGTQTWRTRKQTTKGCHAAIDISHHTSALTMLPAARGACGTAMHMRRRLARVHAQPPSSASSPAQSPRPPQWRHPMPGGIPAIGFRSEIALHEVLSA